MPRALHASILLTVLAFAPTASAQYPGAPLAPSETRPSTTADPDLDPDLDLDPDPDPDPDLDLDLDPDPALTPDPDRGRGSIRGEDVVHTLGDTLGEFGEEFTQDTPEQNRVHWDPSWHRYRFDELVVTLGMGLVILIEELLPTRTDANWQSETDFDTAVAGALGLPGAAARDTVDELSDALVAALIAWPVAIDPLLYTGLGESAWDVAWQLSLISLEVFALNHSLNVLVRLLGRRERPLAVNCREDPAYGDPICDDQPPAESFWSPHVSNAFAGAALICGQHAALDLYGEAWSDGVVCGTAVGAATATAFMRMMSDQTWVTDVLAGAVVGTLIGTLVPYILHFGGGAHPPLTGQEPPTITFLPMFGNDALGISAVGRM